MMSVRGPPPLPRVIGVDLRFLRAAIGSRRSPDRSAFGVEEHLDVELVGERDGSIRSPPGSCPRPLSLHAAARP